MKGTIDTFYGDEYELVRSKRKTMAIQINERGDVQVRAPLRTPKWEIREFLNEKREWIEKQQNKIRARNYDRPAIEPMQPGEIEWLTNLAAVCIPDLADIWAPRIGVEYNRLTIRHQKSRWGSCSADRNLNFNCLLMLAPPNVREYVVVHELCHIKHMDHSEEFWDEVARVLPDYEEAKEWLRTEGRALITRLDD